MKNKTGKNHSVVYQLFPKLIAQQNSHSTNLISSLGFLFVCFFVCLFILGLFVGLREMGEVFYKIVNTGDCSVLLLKLSACP